MNKRSPKYNDLSSSLNGIGVGLRAPHVVEILTDKPDIAWLELLADNHICEGGWSRRQALEIAEIYPVTMHCVGMSIGSVDPINFDYLNKIKKLAAEVKPKIISDHLCWTSLNSHYSHDLLPLPYTEEALSHVAVRINQIQDYLGTRIAIENVSAYLTYQHSTISEVEFVNALADEADCSILFDINNLYVNQVNNQQDSNHYIENIDLNRVAEVHLAGFENKQNYYLDAHNSQVHEDVWWLYEKFLARKINIPTLIEWDHDIPEFSVLQAEAEKAKNIQSKFSAVEESEYELAVTG